MPLDRLVLILVIVIAAAGATIWLGAWLAATMLTPFAWLIALPAGAAAYILIRIISDRLSSPEDDHYDRME